MKLKLSGKNSYYFAIIKLVSSIKSYEKRKLAESNIDITPLMLSYLVIIDDNPNILEKDIAKILGVSKGTLSNMVSNLVRKNLIAKKKNENDKRKWNLLLTSKSKKIIKISNDMRLKFKEYLEETMEKSQIKKLLGTIQLFKDYMKK